MQDFDPKEFFVLVKHIVAGIKNELILFGILAIIFCIFYSTNSQIILIVYFTTSILYTFLKFYENKYQEKHNIPKPSAPTINFRMKSPYIPYKEGSEFGLFTTASDDVAEINVLDSDDQPIGKVIPFYKLKNNDNYSSAPLRFNNSSDVLRLLQSLDKHSGDFYADVRFNDGNTFRFVYRATTDNWRRSFINEHPNLEDNFTLWDKISR